MKKFDVLQHILLFFFAVNTFIVIFVSDKSDKANTMKRLENIIEKHYKKVAFAEIYPEPKTVINGWFGEVKDCMAYIELLGLSSTSDIISDLKDSGLKITIYGLDIYITK